MPLVLSTYVDPGVYIGEVIPPGGVNIATQPLVLGIAGPGSREKGVTNEAVTRGQVEGASLTFLAPSGSIASITAPVGGVQTATDSSGALTTQIIGSTVTVRNATSALNNGTFTITDRPSATTVSYRNPSGVVQAGAAGTYQVKPTAVVGGLADPVRTNRALQNTSVFRGTRLVSDSFLNFRKAHIETALAGPFALVGAVGTKTPCRVATNNEVDTFIAAGTGVGKTLTAPDNTTARNTIDGVLLIVGDRVLVKDYGGTASNLSNGLYTVTQLANGAVPVVLTRATDADASGEFTQFDGVFIREGTVSKSLTYVYTTASAPTVDTTALQYDVANNAFAIEMDGGTPITLILTAGVGVTTVIGTQVTVAASKITTLATATLAQVIAAINEGLSPTDATANTAVTALGYGAVYAAAAAAITGTGLRIQSQITGPGSDVRISAPITADGQVILFGAAGALNRDAPSVLELERVAYSASSTYTIDYVDIEDTEDALENTGILSVSRIGTSPGIGIFVENEDWNLGTDTIDWSIGTAATFTSSVLGTSASVGQFNLSTNKTIRLSFDGLPFIDIDLTTMASPPVGYAAPVAAATTRVAEVASNINAVLAANTNYGPRYARVATQFVVGTGEYLWLTSPVTGDASTLSISTPTTAPSNDATQTIFGLTTAQRPYTVTGTGAEPAAAAVYFVTYTITRPDADYNVQKRFFSPKTAAADLGEASSSNPLMVAVLLAFRQRAASVVVIQVDDASDPGNPTRLEFFDALEATTKSDLITDLAVLSTELAVQTDLREHIESESSPTKKHYRRGWWGMASDTDPGDIDTPDTFVYRARRTLQVAAESPGRGRMILVAPPQREGCSFTTRLNDGTDERIALDSTYLAVMCAAKKTSFGNPASSLASQTIQGLNTDDISLSSIWSPPERGVMASQGVMVVTYDAGNFIILDPVTTEVGGGGLPQFSYESCTSQKDNVTRKVTAAITANLVGIVPTDIADFLIDIKTFVGDVVSGEIGATRIGPFTNQDGSTRRINLNEDIEVARDPDDPTQFTFDYFYNIRYPALRFLGQFSVDSPFFSANATVN